MARVEEKDLRALFPGREDLCFRQAITVADALVDDLQSAGTLPVGRDVTICLYLAAHLTQIVDQGGALSAQTVGQATERYHDIYGPGLRSTVYGQHALMLDSTGFLAKMASLAENPLLRPAEFRVV